MSGWSCPPGDAADENANLLRDAPIATRTRSKGKTATPRYQYDATASLPKDDTNPKQTDGEVRKSQLPPTRRGSRGRKRGRRRRNRCKSSVSEPESQPAQPDLKPSEPTAELETQAEAPEIGGEGDHAKPPLSSVDLYAQEDVVVWAQKDWYGLQRSDPILKRVIALKSKYSSELPKEVLAGEQEEVKLLCRSWPLLRLVKGVLKHFIGEPPAGDETYSATWERIVVPQKCRVELVRVLHRAAAHLSFRRLYPLMRERFWWRTMGTDLKVWTRCCELCQQLKAGDKRGRYPLAQAGYGFPMDRVGIDISGPWPSTSGGNRYILAITDYFSKWLELEAMPDKTAMSVAKCLHRFVSRYGVMVRLHSDRGKEFTASVIQHLCKLLGVEQTFTSGHAPWSNAQVERGNRTVRAMLQALTRQYRLEWDECLSYAMQAYNGTVHASTGYTPHLLMHSRCEDPRQPLDLLLTDPKRTLLERDVSCYSEYIEEQRSRAQEIHGLVREHLGKAAKLQSRMYERAGLRPHEYAVGSEVWYYYPARVTNKLGSPWMGPYPVTGVDLDKNLVRIPLRGTERWINGANVKPVRRLKSGSFL